MKTIRKKQKAFANQLKHRSYVSIKTIPALRSLQLVPYSHQNIFAENCRVPEMHSRGLGTWFDGKGFSSDLSLRYKIERIRMSWKLSSGSYGGAKTPGGAWSVTLSRGRVASPVLNQFARGTHVWGPRFSKPGREMMSAYGVCTQLRQSHMWAMK